MNLKPPVAFIIAVLAAASVMPFMKLMDAMTSPGGDGLSNMWMGALFLGLALLATIAGIIAGLLRKEKYSWLALAALALWVLPLQLMF
jgi:hypothetical protein